MSSPSAQPNPDGTFSPENLPQAFVRAGKVYLCSSCGTLVEIPADVVGKLGWAEQQLPKQPSAEDGATGEASSQGCVRVMPDFSFPVRTPAPPAATQQRPKRPPQPQRPQKPTLPTWAGKAVDGIPVPTGKHLDQAFKWITYHLKVIDRQESELKRLKKLLKTERRKTESTIRVPCPRPRGRASGATTADPRKPSVQPIEEYAQADLGVAPGVLSGISSEASERGPP
ncbi:hypothetical protein C5Y96_05095 [Blastopirellula marina]|uniref:Uncharacterized protein n=1 Tax=Blastopirellula marina TaxID=124 RepID=A0A2S8G458_9BACT|nr:MULTISPECIES: hypothetical protein [Pirellulaceae]PQO39236.1 hypothetical protein C5Y96_05095 [Blastopirellula marina]RCS55544.1 hypothetical protein DTL36_05105 [Bremerella cremea]